MRRAATAALLALAVGGAVGCGSDGVNGYATQYVDEGNRVCAPYDGVISYSVGEDYDVVVCADHKAHPIAP